MNNHRVHIPKRWVEVSLAVVLMCIIGLIGLQNKSIVVDGLEAARSADIRWLLLTLASVITATCVAAITYTIIAIKPLRYSSTVIIEFASGFVTRFIPAGMGAIGIHAAYLYKQKHTLPQAVAVTSVNNSIGVGVHISLFCIIAVTHPHLFERITSAVPSQVGWILLALCIISVAVESYSHKIRQIIGMFVRNVGRSIRMIRLRQCTAAAICAGAVTLLMTTALYSVLRSVGIELSIFEVFIVATVGVFGGTAPPTPGGLGGAEAGIVAALLIYDATGSTAVAAALLYRLCTFVFPIIPGALALFMARRRQLV